MGEEEDAIFTDSSELESAFIGMFNIDNHWEEMNDEELARWLEAIRSDGMNVIEMTDIWEKEISDNEE